MEYQVIKVGGGLLSKMNCSKEVYDHVIRSSKKKKIILVVSAIGRGKDPYSTDGLNDSIKGYLTVRERDRLKSIGETYSTLKVVGDLRLLGARAASLSYKELGLFEVKKDEYKLNLKRLKRAFKSADIVVVPGFLCCTADKEPKTFVREGSDLSAVIIGDKLHCKSVLLIKDIFGIYDKKHDVHHELTYSEFFKLVEDFSSPISIESAKYGRKKKMTIALINSVGLVVCKIG